MNSEEETSSSFPNVVESDLDKFRSEWQAEIRKRRRGGGGRPCLQDDSYYAQLFLDAEYVEGAYDDEDDEEGGKGVSQAKLEEAKSLYKAGMEAEDRGCLSEAITLYRKAFQLVPDISNRVTFTGSEIKSDTEEDTKEILSQALTDDEGDDDLDDLIGHFERLGVRESSICSPNFKSHSAHLAQLPVELVLYILKWVISSEMDVNSLEQLSQVSRGLFLCCRDEGLWKQICERVWGRAVIDLGPGLYQTFRSMYYQRSHVRFNGCYISRTEYFRQGEQSLDNFYKPYQVVNYYRFARFFVDGYVLVFVTPDEPSVAIQRLSQRSTRFQGLLRGKFMMDGERVTAVLKKVTTDYTLSYRYKRRNQECEMEHKFFIEWELTNAGKRQNSLLKWKKYQIVTTHRNVSGITTSDFQVENNKSYPNMIFSRVKSYAAVSEKPMD